MPEHACPHQSARIRGRGGVRSGQRRPGPKLGETRHVGPRALLTSSHGRATLCGVWCVVCGAWCVARGV
eukprot:9183948-Alexandrium_andersonii.AAC.1